MIARATRWRVAAGLAGLVAGTAVLTQGLGDVLVSRGQAAAAWQAPFPATLAAAALLPPATGGPADPRHRALAHRALAAAPLSSEALTYLARDAARQGNDGRARRLMAVAGRTGWRDETAQRQLYNTALATGDAAAAARHADALLRLGKARDELFPGFDRGLALPAFRAALLPYLAASPGWPRDYLVLHGARLGDAVLAEVLAARAGRQGALERELAGPLIVALMQSRRPAAAAGAWRLTAGADGTGPGPLPWQRPEAISAPTAFDWQVPSAYRPATAPEGWLATPTVPGTPPALRLLALPPGSYALLTQAEDESGRGWLWSLACAGERAWPSRPIGGAAAASPVPQGSVAVNCPVQMLAIMPGPDAVPGESRLGPVILARVQP